LFSDIDKTRIVLNKAALKRDRAADLFYKEVEHEGKLYLQTWKRYYLKVPLNHGLARVTGLFAIKVCFCDKILNFRLSPS
jgi:hypothetical protein